MNKLIKMGLIASLALTLAACGKINQENYDKLEVGMELATVENLLGSPDKCDTNLGVKTCQWGDTSKYIKVSYAFDKATLFSNKGL